MTKPQFHAAPDSERWWKLANAIGWSWLIAWWMFPQLIPIRFGRWLFVCLGLMGCANYDYEWKQTHPPSLKPWAYVYALDVDLACRSIGAKAAAGKKITGCAQWLPVGCVIYLPENPPPWIVEHEERHCLGDTHP